MKSVGIDTGGTFTDTVLVDGKKIYTVKTLTSDDLISGIVEGFEQICDDGGIEPSDVDSFNHGSTVAVNALIEETGAKTAFIGTEGFRDLLETGKAYRGEALLYRPCGPVEEPLIPRRDRYGIPERIDADGDIVSALDTEAVNELVEKINEDNFESVCICLLNSYQNGEHEEKIYEKFNSKAPDIDLSLSSRLSPEIREFDRACTTAIDAYLKPEVSTYLAELKNELQSTGIETSISVMNSDGGMSRPNITKERPVTQILSGPVAGVKAAQYIGNKMNEENLITFDMGGTSCDAAVIQSGTPVETPTREIRRMKINGPFININTVGAGGGSIAWLNEVDALRVGPRSAGANPGPVCYGLGGEEPTVTDADLILGILNPENFAGGELELDVDAARNSIEDYIAEPLDMTVEDAAVAIRNVIDSKMASAIRVVSVKEGYDPREFALMGFGGAGPMHACNVANELNINKVIFPNNPGLLSAIGLLVSDISHEYVQSLVKRVPEIDYEETNEVIDDLIKKGKRELTSEDIESSNQDFSVSFDMMYTNQAHYLNISLGGTELTEQNFKELVNKFEDRHESQYSFTDERKEIELVNTRVTAKGDSKNPDIEQLTNIPDTTIEEAKRGSREIIIDTETSIDVPYYDWSKVSPSQSFPGPAIIEQENSTIWIPSAFNVNIDKYKNIIAKRSSNNE